MAKLQFDGPVSPDIFEAPSSQTFVEFIAEYPTIASAMRRSSRMSCVSAVAAMLTLPEFQSNHFRLEVLAHLAVICADGRKPVTATQLAAWFNQLDEGTCGRREDPAEDIFIANVMYGGANYRVFEGTAEGNAFHTQLFLDIIAEMPETAFFQQLRDSVQSILILSENMAVRSDLSRNIVGTTVPQSRIGVIDEAKLRALKTRCLFSEDNLQALGVRLKALAPFLLGDGDEALMSHQGPGQSELTFRPLVKLGEKICVVLPTTLGIAIRALVIRTALSSGQRPQLESALAAAHARRISSEQLLKTMPPPPLQFRNVDGLKAAEALIEHDVGHFLHLLFVADNFENFELGGFGGVNPQEKFTKILRDCQQNIQRSVTGKEVRSGLTLLVACGWGRSFQIALPKPEAGWCIEVISAHDLMTLSRLPKFKLSDLILILDARDKAESLGFLIGNINGLLNLVGWVRSNRNHIVPHEHLDPDILDAGGLAFGIPTNAVLQLRAEAAESVDEHYAARPDGTTLRVVRAHQTPRYGSATLAPFYLRGEIRRRTVQWVYEAEGCNFWLSFSVPDEMDRDTAVHLSKMMDNWGEAVFRLLSQEAAEVSASVRSATLHVRMLDVEMPWATLETSAPSSIQNLFEIADDGNNRTTVLTVRTGFLAAGARADNAAERGLVEAMLTACRTWFDPPLSMEQVQRFSQVLAGDPAARHFHAFSAPEPRDFIRETLPQHARVISGLEDAGGRLGLGWICRERAEGSDIRGRKDCCAYLNSLVRAAAEALLKDTGQFNRSALLEQLLVNHEAAFVEAKLWGRTYRAVRAISEDPAATTAEATKKILGLNGASLASRIVAEMALCVSPEEGGLVPADKDLGRLMAQAMLIFHMGGYSDAMNLAVMPAEIRISPAGDVLMNHGFTDNVIRPFGDQFHGVALSDAANRYEENYTTSEEPEEADDSAAPQTSDRGDETQAFVAAWEEEFGFSVAAVTAFVQSFYKLAVDRRQAVFQMPRPELLAYLEQDTGLERHHVAKALEQFVLCHRPNWASAPAGMRSVEWHPWRFRRQLSLVSRPIIQLRDAEDSPCLVAPVMVALHVEKYVNDARRGRLPVEHFRREGPLARWTGEVNRKQGEAFNVRVAGKIKSLGWCAQANLTDGELLAREKASAFGDIDVLAWSIEQRRVLVIECKDVSLDKTYGEIASRLSRYRGAVDKNGERDDLRRHLDRCEALRAALGRISAYVGFAVGEVESVLMMSRLTPLQFYIEHSNKELLVTNFDELSVLLKIPTLSPAAKVC